MKQLDLFHDGFNGTRESDLDFVKIYESPDKGKTVYERDLGADAATRVLVKTSAQQQWTISYRVQE